jgi:hypothetical protein
MKILVMKELKWFENHQPGDDCQAAKAYPGEKEGLGTVK